MSIQRYAKDAKGWIETNSVGQSVLYTAHAAEVERLAGERDAAARERDAVVEELKDIEDHIEASLEHPHGDDGVNDFLKSVLSDTRAALAKIGWGRNGK